LLSFDYACHEKACQENSEEYVKKIVHVVILLEKMGEKISADIAEGPVHTATPYANVCSPHACYAH